MCRLKSSCGKDGVFYKDLRDKWDKIQDEVTSICNVLFINRRERIPKNNYDPEDLTTLSDISLLPCLYKVFIKCIVERIKSTIIEHTIGYWQRAYISKRDRQELIFCLKTAIDDFRHSNSRFYALFVDFRDAFGSISQESLIKSLLECGIERTYCYIIADIYQNSHSKCCATKD